MKPNCKLVFKLHSSLEKACVSKCIIRVDSGILALFYLRQLKVCTARFWVWWKGNCMWYWSVLFYTLGMFGINQASSCENTTFTRLVHVWWACHDVFCLVKGSLLAWHILHVEVPIHFQQSGRKWCWSRSHGSKSLCKLHEMDGDGLIPANKAVHNVSSSEMCCTVHLQKSGDNRSLNITKSWKPNTD